MGKVEETLRAEIVRLTKKQFRQTVNPLAKEVKDLKRTVSQLSKAIGRLDGAAGNQEKQPAEAPLLQASDEETKSARISSKAIKNIRKKLGISQEKMAALLNVSPGAVAFWEQGRAKPRGENKAALVALRKVGRRHIKRILSEKN